LLGCTITGDKEINLAHFISSHLVSSPLRQTYNPSPSPTTPTTPPAIAFHHAPSPTPPVARAAAPENCDDAAAALFVAVGPPRTVLVGAGNTFDAVCSGNGGKNVALAGVGNATVAERALKLARASALLAAKTLTVVVVVTVLEVGELRDKAWT
jgi:hypothetical protein